MGANIKGIGTSRLVIKGVGQLKEINYSIIPDRIEAGTFIISALITKGKLKIINSKAEHLLFPLKILKKMGAKINIKNNMIIVDGKNSHLKPINIETEPYPGFPTDLQAQFMSLLVTIEGSSTIVESVFENLYLKDSLFFWKTLFLEILFESFC